MRVEMQPAYVLHTRAYRESCLLVDSLSRDYGRLTLLAKGARKIANKSKPTIRHLLQPFMPITVSWLGKSSLKTLSAVEPQSGPILLYEKYLYSAFYINELLSLLLNKNDTSNGYYDLYTDAITHLANHEDIETVLRRFEFALLELLGYGIDFYAEANTGEPLLMQGYYRFVPNLGFVEADSTSSSLQLLLSGETIQSIANNDLQQKHVRYSAKQIARMALKPHLKGAPLRSRELFK